jgi:tripartite-type tricarboxylate transporter receptor subunit TctC
MKVARAAAIAFAFLLAALQALPIARAQDYPAKPITLIAPWPAGGAVDALCRAVAPKLADRLGQSVIVENRPGAGSAIGTAAVAKALPDGYTLLVTSSTHVTNAALQSSVPYDPIKSFTPIGPAAVGNLALVVHPSVPARTVPELVALARSEPGKLNYASPGSGTPHHLAMELFKSHFKVDLTHVPYKGTAGAVTDLLGGQVQVMFLPVHVALVHVQAGKLRMLAAGGAHRSPVTPDVPSLADEGVTGIDVDIWYAMLGPAGLPKGETALLSAEMNAILSESEVRENLLKQGLSPTPGTPEDLARLIDTDLERWTRIVRTAGITAD